jgi:predicted O-methyltransferase YrrM
MLKIIDELYFLNMLNVSKQEVMDKLSKIAPDCEFITSDQKKHFPGFYLGTLSFEKNINNILEIGTGVGSTTSLMAKLFPNSNIFTIDLPSQDKNYKKLAFRKHKFKAFEKNINYQNITFIETNSFFLPNINIANNFDLIYIDGGHCYPSVSWDIMFSYNKVKSGFILIHDYDSKVKVNDVKNTIDYIEPMIKEDIFLLPSNISEKNSKTVFIKK